MIVSFHTKELLAACSNLETAEERLGADVARGLIVMLADIEAAEHADELLTLFGGDATIVGGNVLALCVGKDRWAKFAPVGTFTSREPDGAPDWLTIRRLKLMDIAHCL